MWLTFRVRRHRPQRSPAGIGLVWAEGIRAIDGRHARMRDLDEKSTPMLGFGLAALALLGLERGPTFGASVFLVVALLALGLFATLVALSPRAVASVPAFADLIRLTHRPPGFIQEQYLANFIEAIELTEAALRTKTKWFRIAVAAYVDALAIGAGAIMLGI